MKFSKTFLSIAVLLTSSLTMANSYNAEVGVKYVDNGVTFPGVTIPFDDVSSVQLTGLYNFSAVDTTNKPLAEAAFLGKHSYIDASHSEIDPDYGSSIDFQTIGGGFYIPGSIFFIGAEYQKFEDENDTVVTLGITPLDGLLVTTSHNEEADDYEFNVAAKYVRQLAGDTAINFEAGYQDVEDGDAIITLAADYYFTNFFSVGAGVIDFEDGSLYNIRTRYFFNDNVSLVGEFNSDSETDAESFSIGAAFRF